MTRQTFMSAAAALVEQHLREELQRSLAQHFRLFDLLPPTRIQWVSQIHPTNKEKRPMPIETTTDQALPAPPPRFLACWACDGIPQERIVSSAYLGELLPGDRFDMNQSGEVAGHPPEWTLQEVRSTGSVVATSPPKGDDAVVGQIRPERDGLQRPPGAAGPGHAAG